MRITAALCWYDERPEDLVGCVRGIANIADRIVAVDGAYYRYPGAEVRSSTEQADTIGATAAAAGLEADVVIPDRLWLGQVEKRSFAYARAATDSDWWAIVDTDWIIHTDRAKARAELARVTGDVVAVPFHTPPAGEVFATGWHRKTAGTRTLEPHLLRSLPGVMVEQKHYQISALKGGQRVWMKHYPTRLGQRPVVPRVTLRTSYLIEHHSQERDEAHKLRGRAFCNDRDMVERLTGQEDHVPGVLADPRPEDFDYVTIPYQR